MNKSIQAFRGVAFLFVFMIHAWGFFAYQYWGKAYPKELVIGTQMAVSFFIILSGFLFGLKNIEDGSRSTLWRNGWKRIKRFYPIYFLTFLVMFIVPIRQFFLEGASFDLMYWCRHAIYTVFMIQSWIPVGYYSFNGVGWFLSTIVALTVISTPLFMILNRIERNSGKMFILILIGGTAINLVWSGLIHFCFCGVYDEFLIYIFPLARVSEYTCGMALGLHLKTKRLLIYTKGEILALFVFLFSFMVVIWMKVPDYLTRSTVWVLPSSFLLYIFWNSDGWVTKMLSKSILYYLGNISYEAFLFHYPILYILSMSVPCYLGNIYISVGIVIYGFVITCLVSSLYCGKNVNGSKR